MPMATMNNTLFELIEPKLTNSDRHAKLDANISSITTCMDNTDALTANNTRTKTRLKQLKFKQFYKQYRALLILVCKSIVPDLRSFHYWQMCILILFATFNVIFSILVGYLSCLNHKEYFSIGSLSIALGFQFTFSART
jgi:hypothetical protein